MFGLKLLPNSKKRYSAERLRAVYTDLLQHIDLDNNNLGQRRGISQEDIECHKNEYFVNNNHVTYGNNGNINNNNVNVDLATAFRILSATKSPDKEGEGGGAVAIRDDSSVCGIQQAKKLENRVIELIATIGEIVNRHGGALSSSSSFQNDVKTDPVFEYFSEKCILKLFVDIAKEVRQGTTSRSESSSSSSVHGVVWSGPVKAQVYQTVSLLISNVRDQSIVYYLLSNNYINELIQCMLPLQQWTEPAMSKMVPAYVDLLKNLTLQLADEPHLFPFLTLEMNVTADSSDDKIEDSVTKNNVEFPLFSAALETATSYFAQSDSQIYATCLSIIINLMHLLHPPIQTWICQSSCSQRILADHLCQRLHDRYQRMTNLTRGPVVDGSRNKSIASQLVSLKDEMGMVHEIFWSGVRGMDVRLCESLLQRVVSVLLKSLSQTTTTRPFLIVGLIDADVIPESEALAQVSTIFFSCMFSNLAYVPFQRMLAVALFHPNSTPIWSTFEPNQYIDSPEAYLFMPALSDIVNKVESKETCPNPHRQEILKTLQGNYGDWRTAAAACLLQSILKSDAIDTDALTMLEIISGDESKSIEHSIATFLTKSHNPTAVTSKALECMGHLSLLLLYHNLRISIQDQEGEGEGNDIKKQIERSLSKSPVWDALVKVCAHFCKKAMEFRKINGVSDIFLDLTEAAIKNRYTARYNESGSATFTCLLSRRGCIKNTLDANLLVRNFRGVSANDVESTRFYINMSLHFRSLCKVVDRLCFAFEMDAKISSASNEKRVQNINLDFVDEADELTKAIGGLSGKPEDCADLDLTGRMFFRFQSALKPVEALILVLDPTDIFIVKPVVKNMEENRGTVMCGISLRNIIGAAADGSWLHVAVRNSDAGFLIKNGNMALQFESPGTCLIVKQYLDRSREVLRQNLLTKIPDLLQSPKVSSDGSCVC
ncbi:hypothetical protein FRACYDRAFT_209626 [Fragilariopsis cylindrus CCMP1102]|uniref:FPL domain-containing protein n=1 Tax=Fragilariopsis cylindrus CCMP1102 TaxID=635003 RepID=A0A1E7F527_9STRA|nr:hypothetical protein FRACYDRAFT_209626 [Fragilariopsis cylindrus CCMP1102]|eukprot:OEU13288.1 hypothetical protein FRACYDRAFT_209626 [Fragilariopsis cylindrus CCMP1102]